MSIPKKKTIRVRETLHLQENILFWKKMGSNPSGVFNKSIFLSDLCFSHLKEMLFTSFWNFAFLGQTYQKHFFKMHHFKKMWGTFLLGGWNRNQKNKSIYISFRTGQIFAIAMNIVCLIGFSVSKKKCPLMGYDSIKILGFILQQVEKKLHFFCDTELPIRQHIFWLVCNWFRLISAIS